MKLIYKVTPAALLFGFCPLASAAVFSVSGATAWSLYDSTGTTPLAAVSIVQLGFFPSIDASVDPATYTPAQWSSFVPIAGLGSLNPSKDIVIRFVSAANPSIFGFNHTFEDLDNTPFPSLDPVRLGYKIFDSNDPNSGSFNVVSTNAAQWVLSNQNQGPLDQGPVVRIGRASDDTSPEDSNPGLAWQSGPSGAFSTVIAIPEPSTSLSALLGLGLLVGTRRRK